MMISKFVLTDEDMEVIHPLIVELTNKYHTVENKNFWEEVAIIAQELPRRLRKFLIDFRLEEEGKGCCVISGYKVDQYKIGDTPPDWRYKEDRSLALEEEIFFSLCASILGEPFAWSTQQDGYMMHDIFPMQKHEWDQLGFGSQTLLEWHTEDAFHAYRGDYLGMMCLRNPTQTPTIIASVADIHLTEAQKQQLFECQYTIRPDESHLEKNKSTAENMVTQNSNKNERSKAYQKMTEMNAKPIKISVMFGDPAAPYLRLDPYFMNPCENQEAQQALDTLIDELNDNLQDLSLEAGEICFIDNFRMVHGRRPFKPKFDGQDRWLKRLNVTRDLRKSRDARLSVIDRRIY